MSNRDNNPRKLRDGCFFAFVTNYPTFSHFSIWYANAVQKLYERVSVGNDTADEIALPLLFLMRHSLELGYTYTLVNLRKLNGKDCAPAHTHSLKELHKLIGEEFESLWIEGGTTDSIRDAFKEYYDLAGVAMCRFDALDPKGEFFRYPNDDERPVFQTTINILELKNLYDQAMILLNTTIDAVTYGEGA